jgi:hypothetical protein
LQDKQSDPARSKYRIHPQAVARAVSDLAARDAVFVIDTGLNTLWSGNWIRQSGALGFVELEMKVEGLLDTYTNLEKPDFARVAASGNVPWPENLAITTPQERYPESGVRVSKANMHVVVRTIVEYRDLDRDFLLNRGQEIAHQHR